jgi:hypothetical protein
MVNVKVPDVIVWSPNVKAATALLPCELLYSSTQLNAAEVMVNAVQLKFAEGVQYPVPAVAEVLVDAGVFALVIVTPPAVYPEPEVFVTSPVVEYTVVAALMVALLKYRAALNVSAVLIVRATLVELKLCVADKSSPRNEEHIDWVFAMIFP